MNGVHWLLWNKVQPWLDRMLHSLNEIRHCHASWICVYAIHIRHISKSAGNTQVQQTSYGRLALMLIETHTVDVNHCFHDLYVWVSWGSNNINIHQTKQPSQTCSEDIWCRLVVQSMHVNNYICTLFWTIFILRKWCSSPMSLMSKRSAIFFLTLASLVLLHIVRTLSST